MELTKHGHACVVLADGERRLVIDPGGYTEPAALEVWTNTSVAAQLEGLGGRVHVVGHGDAVSVDGWDVRVHGELHAEIHPEIPRIANVGFLVDRQVFHPGDALTVPEEPVATLLVPMMAPWSRTADVIDYVRAVAADQAFAVHDGLLNDTGLGVVGGLLGERGPGTPTPFSRLAPGDTVEL